MFHLQLQHSNLCACFNVCDFVSFVSFDNVGCCVIVHDNFFRLPTYVPTYLFRLVPTHLPTIAYLGYLLT